jgi:microsomal dipeptidase-like Zn-dependent dipeptidase
MWNRDLHDSTPRGHVDRHRLAGGNVCVQVFSAVTAVPLFWRKSGGRDSLDVFPFLARFSDWRGHPDWPDGDRFGALPERTRFALYQARKLKRQVAESGGWLRLILSKEDLRAVRENRKRGRGETGVLLALEGAHVLGTNLDDEGDYLDSLRSLYDAGFRMLGLAHGFDNDIAGSSQGVTKHGLTAAGKKVVQLAMDKGMIIDLSHSSEETIEDVLEMAAVSGTPVIASHGGVKHTCDSTRNLGPAQIRGIARTNGAIGVGLFKDATCGDTLDATVQAMRYIMQRAGPDHVALGSDFDGFVATPIDAGQLNRLTGALEKALCDCTANPDCLGEAECHEAISKIMGQNALRVFEAVLPERSP